MGGWQDWLVTGVAGIAGAIVVWRTFGSWKDSTPGGAGSPHCDGCAIKEMAQEAPDRKSP